MTSYRDIPAAPSARVQAALSYATRGWLVFPVQGKAPLTRHGCNEATTDPVIIDGWWKQWPTANVAIATGHASGLVVLDIDGAVGEASLATLHAEGETLPSTLEVHTGGNGRHLYFQGPVGVEIRNSASRLGAGLDVRGEGGYVVAPPSIHATGRSYAWDNDREPAPCPGWLTRRLLAHGTQRRPTKIAPGQRNSTLASIAGSMRRHGASREEIEAALLAANAERCEPPLPEVEIRRIAHSISQYPSSSDRSASFRHQQRDTTISLASERPIAGRGEWPRPLRDAAYHGLIGEVVKTLNPHTEADPAALLIQMFAMFGNVIGSTAHWRVEGDTHYLNLYVVVVGETAKGRKGVSAGHGRRIFERIDPTWSDARVKSGLSSGEGLIHAVRDPIKKRQPIKKPGGGVEYELVIDDPGESDKRLLVVEPEFSRVLRVLDRDGNTLSAVMRQAWDGDNLRVLTKSTPAQATGPHISIVGQITRDELRRDLDRTETANGFGNRILWVCVRRSKELPDGGGPVDLDPLIERLKCAVERAQTIGEMRRDAEAATLWRREYGRLSAGRPGLLGAMTARAEAQVMRLACLYTLADCSSSIALVHLRAALELWRYCYESATYLFGDRLGDATADFILCALRDSAHGLTRSDITRGLFARNKPAAEIDRALSLLKGCHLAVCERDRTGDGRPTERWFSVAYDINDKDDISPSLATGNVVNVVNVVEQAASDDSVLI